MTNTPSPPLALLERELELAAAGRAVDVLCRERPEGGLLVYNGAAGIGKTAVLAHLREAVAGRCTVWSARGAETATSVPFHVVRQLLGRYLATLAPPDARALLAGRYDIVGPALGITAPVGTPADPQGVRDGLDRIFAQVAQRHRTRPLVLVVDDAHWADRESLTWLASFTARLPELPLLIVLAHRPEELTGHAQALLAGIGGSARLRVTIRALTPEATADLTRSTLGKHADDPFCREVWAVTGGNPYEAVELLAKVRARAVEPVEDAAGHLRELSAGSRGRGLVERIQKLGTDATRLAWAAAVLGTDIPLDLATSLAGLTPRRAARCTEQLRTARILTGRDPLEFFHPLIATAVYGSIPLATRTAMHGRAAWTITQAGLGAAAASRHLLEVHPGDDPELVHHLREAAREHLAVGAPDAARRCLERALREPPPPPLRAPVLYELGCATLLTSPADTVRHLRAALDLPELADDLRVDATFRYAQGLAHNQQMREASLSVAFAAAATEPGPGRMRLQAAHFMYDAFRGTEDDGRGRSNRLAALADHLQGRDNTERALLTLRAFDAMLRSESAAHVVDLCDRALAGGRPARGLDWTDTEWGFEYPCLIGITYTFADRLDEAEALFTEAVSAYEISGWSGAHLAFAHTLVGSVHRRRGRLAEAEVFLREGLRLADRIGSGLPVHWDATCLLVDTLLARGRVHEAERVADTYSFGPPYPDAMILPDGFSVRGKLLLALGREEEAVAELQAAATMAQRGRHNSVWAPWPGDLARALAAHRPERAAALVAEARLHAERFGTHTAIGQALTWAAALAEPDEAVALLERAVTHLAASPSRYEHAVARVEYGLALRSPDELRHGLSLARACGAEALAARAGEALA